MSLAIHKMGMSSTCSLLLSDQTAVACSLVRPFAVGTFRREIPALLRRAFPGRMLFRAEPTLKLPIWTLGLHVPVFLALFAHLHPSFLAIGPVGERMGMPNRTLADDVIGHNRVCELDHERSGVALWLCEPPNVRDLDLVSLPPVLVLRNESPLEFLTHIHELCRHVVNDNPPYRDTYVG